MIKAILMKLFLNRFNNNYCLTGIHHSLQHFLALTLATVRLTSRFIIRLLHDVTSAEQFLLKKSNQNFLLFTCNTLLKYISCFFVLINHILYNCLSRAIRENIDLRFRTALASSGSTPSSVNIFPYCPRKRLV